MNPLTEEWVAKADGDYRTARRELQAPEAPNYDAASFHAQQCAEKYIKALLVESGIAFPKTHDLETLLDLLIPAFPAAEELREALISLTDMGVEVRYPGVFADEQDALRAVGLADAVRQMMRQLLALPEEDG